MKHVDEYRSAEASKRLSSRLHQITTRPWTIMEVCGGQTHTILQYGIEDLLPSKIELLHGPGCPVCVTPLQTIDKAVAIADQANVIFCSFGDMLRIPGSNGDLFEARGRGADVRIVYSPLDPLAIAIQNPDKQVVFFAVGFETTAPANAMAIHQAKERGIKNFSALCSLVRVPPVITAMVQSPENRVQAFLGPGHVCSIMGFHEYTSIAADYKIPIVVTGFEPVDILEGIYLAVQQLECGTATVENQYKRAVNESGNKQAQELLSKVFDISERPWRGLGSIPDSGFRLSSQYKDLDADLRFDLPSCNTVEPSECISGEILKGHKKPFQCKEFGIKCTPEHPLGATMVSAEGTCANYFKFGKHHREN